MATFDGYNGNITDNAGNSLAGATVKVYNAVDSDPLSASNTLAVIYSDRDGATTIDQTGAPLQSGSEGEFTFYSAGGNYHIVVTNGADTSSIPDVAIGTAQRLDTSGFGDLAFLNSFNGIKGIFTSFVSSFTDTVTATITVDDMPGTVYLPVEFPAADVTTPLTEVGAEMYDPATKFVTLTGGRTYIMLASNSTVRSGTQFCLLNVETSDGLTVDDMYDFNFDFGFSEQLTFGNKVNYIGKSLMLGMGDSSIQEFLQYESAESGRGAFSYTPSVDEQFLLAVNAMAFAFEPRDFDIRMQGVRIFTILDMGVLV